MTRRKDEGSQHILEVTVILCVAFATASTILPFLEQPAATANIEALLERQASDALQIWKDTPNGRDAPCEAPTVLDMLLSTDEGQAHWNAYRQRDGAAGIDADLVVENMYGVLPVHGPGNVVGATEVLHWAPDQTFLVAQSRMSVGSGMEALAFEIAPVREATLQRARGEAIKFHVDFQAELERDYARSTSGLTALPKLATEGAGSLVWQDNSQQPMLVADIEQLSTGTEEVSFFLAVSVPAGAEASLEIAFPHTWTRIQWKIVPKDWVTGTAAANHTLWASRAVDGASTTTFTFSATPSSSPARSFDIITARLSGPSRAESSLVVTYPLPDADRGTPRVLANTTPYPVARGQDAPFGVAFANGGDEVVVTRVDIEVPGGYDLKFNDGLGACTGFSDGLAPDQASKSREKPRF